MSEYFDIYDEDQQHIGVKARDDVHREGYWHQVFHCWVIGRDAEGIPFVILQKRADDKQMYAGKIDLSAAGHLEAGESVRDGVRELEEELGLRVEFEALVPLGRRVDVKKNGQLVDYQICHVFFYECDRGLAEYVYQVDEIAGLLKLPIADGLRLFAGETASVTVDAVGLGSDRVSIGVADFIKNVDQYAYKALILARRYFDGEKDLLI